MADPDRGPGLGELGGCAGGSLQRDVALVLKNPEKAFGWSGSMPISGHSKGSRTNQASDPDSCGNGAGAVPTPPSPLLSEKEVCRE